MTHPYPSRASRWLRIVCLILVLAPWPIGAIAPTHEAYVTNAEGNSVSVIDTEQNEITATIPVGLSPAAVVISGDGTRAYVINRGSNSLSVIDTATHDVATVVLGDTPSSVAAGKVGSLVYVLGETGLFSVIDASTISAPSVVRTTTVGTQGGRIAVSPNGKHVYGASGGLFDFDTEINTLVSRDALSLAGPGSFYAAVSGVAITPDGKRAFVSLVTYNYGQFGFNVDGQIAVVDLATGDVSARIPLFSQPGAVVFTTDGSRAYVTITSYWANTGYGAAFLPGQWVAAIDTATNEVLRWIDVARTPGGIAVTPDRANVYVAVPANNSVARIDAAENAVVQLIAIDGAPADVATLPDAAAAPRHYVVDAVDDTVAAPVAALSGGVAAENVLANDTIDGNPAAPGNVTIAFVSATSDGVTLDAKSGSVSVSPDTPVGPHTLTYRICEAGNDGNCDDATVSLTVRAPFVIRANADRGAATAGAPAIASVLDNDTLEGGPAVGAVSLSLVAGDPGLAFNAANGSIVANASANAGEHTLTYGICELASPANCAQATATVLVTLPMLRAGDDTATTTRAGGEGIVNVLANDTLDGSAATLARVTLSSLAASDPGVTLNASSGAISVARGTASGTQSLTYRACEIDRANNCSDATVTVVVKPYVILAVNDSVRASSKNGGSALINVLANDSLGGARINAGVVKVTRISLSPSNKEIRLNADGTVDVLGKTSGGTYALVYEICEAASPANCARATLTIDLSGKN